MTPNKPAHIKAVPIWTDKIARAHAWAEWVRNNYSQIAPSAITTVSQAIDFVLDRWQQKPISPTPETRRGDEEQ